MVLEKRLLFAELRVIASFLKVHDYVKNILRHLNANLRHLRLCISLTPKHKNLLVKNNR